MAILNSEEKDTIVSERWASRIMANQIIKMTAGTPGVARRRAHTSP